MRRQLGADAVDIDTRASTCRVAFAAPVVIDPRRVREAALDASYTLVGLTLEAQGRVLQSHCESCGSDVHVFELPGTGQRFELDEPWEPGEAELVVDIEDWYSDHALLRTEPADGGAAPGPSLDDPR